VHRVVITLIAALAGLAPRCATALDLAPTGTLRATFIGGNAVQAVLDPVSGEARGPAADIVRELARRSNVPFAMKGVPGVAAVIASIKSGEADMGFLAYAADRAEVVDFARPHLLAQNSYMVLADSALKLSSDVDRAGIRVAVTEGDVADLVLAKTLKNAELKRNHNPSGATDLGVSQLRSGEIQAYAASRQRLAEAAAKTPGLRILADNFYSVPQALVIAKGHPAELDIINRFLDEARSNGFLRASIERAGLAGADVAPAQQ
jgi:polar amino acid transport system substrate-binding protein